MSIMMQIFVFEDNTCYKFRLIGSWLFDRLIVLSFGTKNTQVVKS